MHTQVSLFTAVVFKLQCVGKRQFLTLLPKDSDAVRLGWYPSIFISNKFLGDNEADDPWNSPLGDWGAVMANRGPLAKPALHLLF